ncbi:S41 family peptidase [Duganella violaceipulchra]|uniref:Tail specific protease domain-containing protein n=1 Tax=Duganella violaceipulchra TaxID=2849652 RepID=A0AA41KZJ6_9BURK|nr:S41 family peptidase [Duganella violaceicalia]MBV6320621.1 hypothetical protein [Duganella violaceicalia]MCP2008670.1 hypothetical protein [Duganella violaceicalia]
MNIADYFQQDAGAQYTNVELVKPAAGKAANDTLVLRALRAQAQTVSAGIDAEHLRGKIVELHFRIRSTGGPTPARAWLRSDVYGGSARMVGMRLQLDAARSEVSTRLLVDSTVTRLRAGIELAPGATAILSDVTLRVLDTVAPSVEVRNTEPLAPDMVRQLNGFGHALALVRYFSPSRQSETADWNAVARAGARLFSMPLTPAEYAAQLRNLLGAYAPEALWLAPDDGANPAAIPDGAPFVVRQVHRGYGTRHAFYGSAWEYARAAEAPWKHAQVREALAGGVTLVLPLAATAPRLPSPALQPAYGVMLAADGELPPARVEPEFGAEDRYTRLADALQLWGALRYFYPYDDVLGIDWNEMLDEALAHAARDADTLAFRATLSHMTATLRDGHAWIRSASFHDEYVPPLRLALIDGHAYAVPRRTADGVPCDTPVIPSGSELVSVDGLSVPARRDAMLYLRAGASETARQADAEEFMLAGREDVPAAIVYTTLSGELRRASLRRSISSFALTCPASLPALRAIHTGIWYVDLSRVTEAEVQAAMPSLARASAIIFDVRGYVTVDPALLGHFSGERLSGPLTEIPLIASPRPQDWQWRRLQRHFEALQPHIAARAFYLTGGGTISASETYLQIVRHHQLGTIVGERTAGTSGDVASMVLPGGFTAYWTGLRFLRQDGERFHGLGVTPDVEVHPSLAGLMDGRDEVLDTAVELAVQAAAHPEQTKRQ